MPEYVTALLRYVSDEIARVESNRIQDIVEPPTGWTGQYSTSVFTMRGYRYPGDDGDVPPPNFEADVEGVGHLELRWYKHLGRGMSVNRALNELEWVKVFDACVTSVRATEPSLR